MQLNLKRLWFESDGIYSQLTAPLDAGPKWICVTLEHAYEKSSLGVDLRAYPEGFVPGHDYLPKIPNGLYICRRGPHRLHSMTQDFETFEVTGVKGHAGILFHCGNYNEHSEGCVLVGDAIVESGRKIEHPDGPDEMLTNSRDAFDRFMAYVAGLQEFELLVEG